MALIKPITDWLTRDWGHIPEENIPAIEEILRDFMSTIGKLTDRHAVVQLRTCHPDLCQSCSSCGLSRETDLGKGFIPTAYGLLRALVKDGLFLCHGNQPSWKEGDNIIDTERLRKCGNFVSLTTIYSTTLRRFAIHIMVRIRQVVWNQQPTTP